MWNGELSLLCVSFFFYELKEPDLYWKDVRVVSIFWSNSWQRSDETYLPKCQTTPLRLKAFPFEVSPLAHEQKELRWSEWSTHSPLIDVSAALDLQDVCIYQEMSEFRVKCIYIFYFLLVYSWASSRSRTWYNVNKVSYCWLCELEVDQFIILVN